MNAQPNATAATGSTGAGLFLVWLLGHLGVDMGAEVAVVIAGGLTTFVLLVGRDGIRGLFRTVWRGKQKP
jgi:hypothetical protein